MYPLTNGIVRERPTFTVSTIISWEEGRAQVSIEVFVRSQLTTKARAYKAVPDWSTLQIHGYDHATHSYRGEVIVQRPPWIVLRNRRGRYMRWTS